MRLLSRFMVLLAICIVAITLPSAPAQAAGGSTIWLDPTSGVPGGDLTVYGSNFTPTKYVDIYYDVDDDGDFEDDEWMGDTRVDSGGEFDITFEVPESYKGAHAVLAQEASTSAYSAEADFTVKPGLTVDPEDGLVGSNVTVEGHGFTKNERKIELRYYLDGTAQTVASNFSSDADGSWEKIFQIPSSAQGSHKIDAQGDDSSLAAVQDVTFEVIPGITLDKSSGSPGENITMMGSGFHANDRYIKILIAGEQTKTVPDIIRADDTGSWNATFKVPEMPTEEYSVTAEGELTAEEDITALSFEIGPGLVLSPNQGHVGTDLTVTGGGFATGKNVIIRYDGTQEATATTNSSGGFTATFTVPESQHGARQVSAEVDGIVEATAIFTMESVPPPVPELISPADKSRVGIIGRTVRPTFEWSEVFDVSGVHYSLQVARSADVTAAGLIDPIVSVADIVGTNYTLNATEALPYGTYYWVVQAVDGADNKGGWTAADSFRAGVLPLWAFIVAVVAVAAGIGCAVYFFVIRKRIYYY
jgi:hypothetical protein